MRSLNNDDVLLSGGSRVSIGNLKRGEIKEVQVAGQCGEFYLDNTRYVKARSPNVEWKENTPFASGPYHTVVDLRETTETCYYDNHRFKQTCPQANWEGFVFNDEFGQDWDNLQDTEVMIFHSWINEYAKVDSIVNVNGRNEVLFQSPLRHGSVGTYPRYGGYRYIIFNNRALLDQPGEYYCQPINATFSEVSFIPLEDVDQASVVMAQNKVLFQVNTATNVKMNGLRFQHTSSNGVVDGYQWGQHSALRVITSQSIEINNCQFAHLGVIGVYATNVQDVVIKNSHFDDIGYHAILFLYNKEAQPTRNVIIQNNKIEGSGLTNFWQPAGIWAGAESNMTIANNDVSGPPTGIRINSVPHRRSLWTENNVSTPTRDDYLINIEYNKVYNLGRGTLNDFGGIYLGPSTSGFSCDDATIDQLEQSCFSYTRVFNNMISNANSYLGDSAFLYSDVSLGRVTFESNYMFGDVEVAMKHHCGLDNLSFNNLIHTSTPVLHPNRNRYLLGGCGSDDRFWAYENYNNIYYMENITNLAVFRPRITQVSDLHDNLYWSPVANAQEEQLFWNGTRGELETWQEWLDLGYDTNSVWEDPKFDLETKEFADDSPALAMGFKPIDFQNIGMKHDIKYDS